MESLLEDWDYERNRANPLTPDTPEQCSAGKSRPVFWKCHICSYEWAAPPCHRIIGKYKCPNCEDNLFILGVNDLKTWCDDHSRQDILNDWDAEANKNDSKAPNAPTDVRFDKWISVHWKCSTCGHTWVARIADRTKENAPKGCEKCSYVLRAKKHQKKVINLDTGDIYESQKEAELATTGKIGTGICSCCKGVKKPLMAFTGHIMIIEKADPTISCFFCFTNFII